MRKYTCEYIFFYLLFKLKVSLLSVSSSIKKRLLFRCSIPSLHFITLFHDILSPPFRSVLISAHPLLAYCNVCLLTGRAAHSSSRSHSSKTIPTSLLRWNSSRRSFIPSKSSVWSVPTRRDHACWKANIWCATGLSSFKSDVLSWFIHAWASILYPAYNSLDVERLFVGLLSPTACCFSSSLHTYIHTHMYTYVHAKEETTQGSINVICPCVGIRFL